MQLEPQKTFSIYCITNTVNGKKYVGKTSTAPAQRWKAHVKESRSTRSFEKNIHLQNAIRKYGEDSFNICVLVSVRDKEHIDFLERLWISSLQTNNPDIGYNMTPGGDGVQWSKEASKKQSERMKELWADPTYRDRVIKAHIGFKQSEETKKKHSERPRKSGPDHPLYGIPLSAEHRQRLSAAMTGKPATTKGRKHTLLDIQKISQASTDRWKNPEYKERLSKSLKSARQRRKQKAIEDTANVCTSV